MKRYRIISYAALALLSFAASCVKEQIYENTINVASKPKNLDELSLTTATGSVACDADKLEYLVTVSEPGTPSTKSGLPDVDKLARAEVSLVSYAPGTNAEMSAIGGGGPATKSIYDQVTTRDLNANFLRLDENVGAGDVATYTWQTWDNAQMLEASVIATPDNTDGLYYRTVTFNPSQAYNIRTFHEELVGGMWIPKDTIFYHTRMIGWYPMICSVPVGGSGDKAVIQFRDSRYTENRAQIGSNNYGVVFDHVLDGSVDVMMSNMCEAQRWHSNFGKDDVPTPHYVDMDKTIPEAQENYHFPFGHNEEKPTYSNPIYFHHYLSGIRLWAKVDQSGDAATAQMNLLTWGKILSVSVVHQPSTVVVALPTEVSSPVFMDEYGRLVMKDGKTKVDKTQVKFGEVQEWSDYDNMPIRTELMYGEGDINHKNDDYTASYPIDMAEGGNIHGMEAKYLGYFLIKPCKMGETKEEDETITLAIQTEGGTYQAVIPCRALVEDERTHTSEETNVFLASKVYDITLNLKTAGTFSDFIAEEGDEKYVDLSPYDETQGTYKTANSYIVPTGDLNQRIEDGETAPGYTFAANIIGNGQAGILSQGSTTFHTSDAILTGVTKAEIEWQSNPEQIFNVQYQHGYIRFQMKNATPGNAVIAATDDTGKILWSWHIWITDQPGNVTINGVQFMDRNMGATYGGSVPSSASDKLASYGLYYQWGRKDPLPTPLTWDQNESTDITPVYDEYGTEVPDLGAYVFDQCKTLTDAIEHPMHYALSPYSPYYQHNWLEVPIDFLWGKADGSGQIQKSVYDPCPFGYRIVHEELQSLLENGSTTVTDTDGAGLVVTNGSSSLYLPYAGFFGPDRNYTSNSDAGYFMGQKGDYTSGVICPDTDADANEYFSGHRLRTYISQATSWNSENIDGVTSFTYKTHSQKHYVQSAESVPSRRDYGNRKTAGSVRCVADGSYVHMAFAHIKSLTPSISAGGTVYLDLNGGINLGAIQNAYLESSHPDKDGNTRFYAFKDGSQHYDFLHYLDGNVTATTIKGTFKFDLPPTLESDKYTFTLYVEERDGANASQSCEVRNTGVSTVSMVSTVEGTNTDGKHPYAGQNFSLVVTLKAGPATTCEVSRNDFTAGGVQANSATKTGPDADGFYTVTLTFNNVHIDEAGLDKTLNLSGKVTMDGNVYNWSDIFHTEVWQKVGNDAVDTSHPYTSLADASGAEAVAIVSNGNRYLYNNGGTPSLTGTYGANDNYLWSLTSSGAILNLGNERYLSVSTNSGTVSLNSTTAVNHTFTLTSTNYFYIIRTRYLRDNGGTLTTSSSSSDDRRWRIYPVTRSRYVDPHMTGSNWSMSGDGLHDGHPVAGKKFTASYKVTVADADAVTFTSATIDGVAATGNVVKVGNNYEVTLTADVTPSAAKKNVEFPIKVTLGVTSSALGLTNASITQYYSSPATDVWKYSLTSRTKGDQITTLANLTAEDRVFMINANYNDRYTAANDAGNGFTSSTTISTANDSQIWSVAASDDGYTIRNIGSGNYLVLNATPSWSGNNYNKRNCTWSYGNSPALATTATDLSITVNSNNFQIDKAFHSEDSWYAKTSDTTCHFCQTGTTTFSGNTGTTNRNWTFYKVVDTYSYSAPTE